MKDYTFEVKVKWTQGGIEADNINEAIQKLQDTFKDEYNFIPTKEEITLI